jgi:hypothetical protein
MVRARICGQSLCAAVALFDVPTILQRAEQQFKRILEAMCKLDVWSGP